MPLLSQEHKHQALVQLWSGVSTHKVAALLGMSQSLLAHLKKDVMDEMERQKGGRPKRLVDREKMSYVTLVTEGWLGTTSAKTKQLRSKTCKLLFDITARRTLREVGLGAQVQQRKPFLSRKHVLAHLRFAQRYENWSIDDWKCVIVSDETKINMFNSDSRSWCWIGDGEHIGPPHVHQTVKHGDGSVMIWGCMMAFGPGAWYKLKVWCTNICTNLI